MPSRRTLIVSVATALLVTASGCSALQSGGGSVDADAIADRTLDSLDAVDSYRYDTTVDVDSAASSMTINATGSVDLANEKLRLEQTVNGQHIVQYRIEGTLYTKTSGAWSKEAIENASAFWTEQHPLAVQRSYLADANATFEGNTTVDGTDVYELSVDVGEERIIENLESTLGPGFAEQVTIEEVSHTTYVSHDDDRLVRAETELTMSAQGQSVESMTTVTFSGYEESVSVELPPEAENAESTAGSE